MRGEDAGDRHRQGVQGRRGARLPVLHARVERLGQSDGRKAAERFLERYNETGSLRPGDYSKVTRNASYYVGLLAHADS